MNSCIFVSVCNKFLLFLLAFNRLSQLTHDLFYFIIFSIQYCQTSLCYHAFERREVQSFHMAIQQKLSRTDALKRDGETTK